MTPAERASELEAVSAGGAEAVFHGRFFPREEGGTNVRTVFAQVRLRSALTASAQHRCPEALAMVDVALEPPEALLPLDRTAKGSRLLLLFDGSKDGAPHVIQLGE